MKKLLLLVSACSLFIYCGNNFGISDSSKKIASSVENKVTIEIFSSEKVPALSVTRAVVKTMAEQFSRAGGGKINVDFFDVSSDEEARNRAVRAGIVEVRVQEIEENRALATQAMGIVIQCGHRKEVIPFISDHADLEYQLAKKILQVSTEKPKRIAILTPYLPNDSIPAIVDSFKQRFEKVIDILTESYEVRFIEPGITAIPEEPELILALESEKSPLSPASLYALDQFLMRGGKALIATNGISVTFENGVSAAKRESKLHVLLKHYGISVKPELILDKRCAMVSVPQKVGAFTMNMNHAYPFFVKINPSENGTPIPGLASVSELVFAWTSPLYNSSEDSLSGKIRTLLFSSDSSWVQSDSFNLDPKQQWELPDDARRQPIVKWLTGSAESYFSSRERPEGITDAFTSESENVQLAVIGNANFLTSANTTIENSRFFANLVEWVMYDEIRDIQTLELPEEVIEKYTYQKTGKGLFSKLIETTKEHYREK